MTGLRQRDLPFDLSLGVPPKAIFKLPLMPVCFYQHDGQPWSGALCSDQSQFFTCAYSVFSNAFMYLVLICFTMHFCEAPLGVCQRPEGSAILNDHYYHYLYASSIGEEGCNLCSLAGPIPACKY